MKHLFPYLFLFCFLNISLYSGVSIAQQSPHSNRVIAYQGFITSKTAGPVTDEIALTVTLYGNEAGMVKVWQGTYKTFVREGVFDVSLGSGDFPLPESKELDRPLWVGVTLPGGEELRPLTALGATPLALNVSDGSITKSKLNTNYISGITVDGEQLSGVGATVNLKSGPGISLVYDPGTNDLLVTSQSGLKKNRDKGSDPQFVGGDPAGTNSDDGVANSGNHANSTNTVGGGTGNTAFDAVAGAPDLAGHATVGGGTSNTASGTNATVSGGTTNAAAAPDATVAGGNTNSALAGQSTVSGGVNNTASSTNTTVGGGTTNTASASDATIGGGNTNNATGSGATIAGGTTNSASGTDATVGGGNTNGATNTDATVSGGISNTAGGANSSVGGGTTNTASNTNATVAGGTNNSASGSAATVAGGNTNAASNTNATVSGGISNTASGVNAFVGGGTTNLASNTNATVGGGTANRASGSTAFVGGGNGNVAANTATTVGAGQGNTGGGDFSTVGGGIGNTNQFTLLLTTTKSFIGGGASNTISDNFGTIGGGLQNWAGSDCNTLAGIGYPPPPLAPFTTDAQWATVGGGQHNASLGQESAITGGVDNVAGVIRAYIGGGFENSAYGPASVIDGGEDNQIGIFLFGVARPGVPSYFPGSSRYGVIGGGFTNWIDWGDFDVIGGGWDNTITGASTAVIGGGVNNTVTGTNSTIGGGTTNFISSTESVIGGGTTNVVGATNGTVGGGSANTVSGTNGMIGGGISNSVTNTSSAVGGGSSNSVTGTESVISGGLSNTISGTHSAIAGGSNLKIGDRTFGFNGDAVTQLTDLTVNSFSNVALINEADLWIGNVNNSARSIQFFEPNNGDLTYTSANFTSIKAGSQSANINYTWPTSIGGSGSILFASSTAGTASQLAWLAPGANGSLLSSTGSGLQYVSTIPTSMLTGVLPISKGGTNSGTALNNTRVMVSSGGAIVENPSGTSNQLLHGDLAWGAVNLANSQVTGILPVANGGTGSGAALVGNRLIMSNSTNIQEVAAGSAGQILASSGTTAQPAWNNNVFINPPGTTNAGFVGIGMAAATPAAIQLDVNGGISLMPADITVSSTPFAIVHAGRTFLRVGFGTVSNTTRTVTLNAGNQDGHLLIIHCTCVNNNKITFSGSNLHTSATITLDAFDTATFIWCASTSGWILLSVSHNT